MKNSSDEVKDRIRTLMKERKISENKLADGDLNLQGRLNGQLSHNTKLSVDTLLFILDKFPDVSADWLLRGKECKSVTGIASVGDNSIANNNNTTVNDTEAVRCLVTQLEEKDRQIDRLLNMLERLQVG